METTKQLVLKAFRGFFGPIAGILLRAGVTWREVMDVAKTTYVDVASRDFGIRGRPTNISRVSILTGLTRRDVSRIRKLLERSDSNDVVDSMNHATRVLTGWHTDADFSSDNGAPLPLAKDGTQRSFDALCKRYVGDVPPTTMLKELIHVGAVETDADGNLVARKRNYMPRQLDAAQILSSGSVLEDLGNTVAYNLYRSSDDMPKFERRATNTQVRAADVPAFQNFLEQEGQAFLERVDAWLSDHEAAEDSGEATVRLGLGAYWIEE
ncbi:MAG: DUF6502 family protein [Pseudomonadota bacterium]